MINAGVMMTGFTAGAVAIAGLWSFNPGFAVPCVPMAASCLIVLAAILRLEPGRPRPGSNSLAVALTGSALATLRRLRPRAEVRGTASRAAAPRSGPRRGQQASRAPIVQHRAR